MKPRSLMTRILSVILVLAMVVGASPMAFATGLFESRTQKLAFEKVEGVEADVRLDASKVEPEEEEPEYADTDMVRVSIVLESQPTLERYSTINVAENAQAIAYRGSLEREQSAVTARIEKQILNGESLDVVWNMTLAGNIISANVAYGKISEIETVSGVAEVIIENRYEPMVVSTAAGDPMMATSSEMIGSTTAWAAGYTGAGTRIAVIDTGLDTDHQSFDADAYLHSLGQLAADKGLDADSYIESLDLLDAAEIAGVLTDLNIYPYVEYLTGTANGAYYVSEKVPFALNYVDRDYEVTHDDGLSEHGSHVAGIAAANSYISTAAGFENALEAVATQGVAPDAQIIVMKVFGKTGGAYESDYMVAIEDAIMLGCDVVNLSLGTDKGFARSSQYQKIMDNLAGSDTVVAVAAGNSGHWAEYAASGMPYLYADDVDMSMVASPSAVTNALSVASVNNAGATNYYISVDGQIIFYQPGIFSDGSYADEMTTLAGEVSYIFTDSIGTAEDVAAIVANEGEIAANTVLACSRGTINFGEKANNAAAAGFAGTIIYNNDTGVLNMNLDGYNYSNPAVSVTMADGAKLKAAAQAVTDGEGNVLYYKGTMTVSDKVGTHKVTDAYVMSSFSSWGVPGSLQLKPEITAPGGDIYSVDGSDPGGTAYENMSGTSMASPQVAGMSALVMQYIRENGLDDATGMTARQLATSLLMATAEPLKDGANYYPVLQQGAGLANVGSALEAKSCIVMADAATSGAADGKVKAELGDDPHRTGRYSFSFTLNNFSDDAAIYSLHSDFFTQFVFSSYDERYLSTSAIELGMAASYAIDGSYINASSSFDCDLNADGVTDELDAQIILDYAAGNQASIDGKADLDEDGSINTYDAHLLLASIRSDYFKVAPGDSVTVTVSMTLNDGVKAYLDENYVNGAYLEGYVYVTSAPSADGELEPEYSIPVLGFYGNWSDASMYDHLNYEEYVYASANGTDFRYPYSGGMNYLTFYDSHHNETYYVGNPYLVEDQFPADKIAISPDMELGDMAVSLIRNAGGFMFYVADGEGNIVRSTAVDQLRSAYYYINGGYWAYVNTAGLSIWETPGSLGGFGHGDQFTVGFMAIPEYYEKNGALTADDMLAYMASGDIGEGAYHTYSFTVDGEAPEILSVSKAEDGDLIVSAKDDRHIAAMAVLSASGSSVLTLTGVDQDELGAAVETVIDMEGVAVNRTCMVMVADYAGNESYYTVAYNDGLDDFNGRMYAFTNTATRGALNTWMEIDPENISYGHDEEGNTIINGTTEMAVMDCAVTAAEYVNGYVYMITENNQLVVALQGEWDWYSLARTDSGYAKIRDMAYDTANGVLYALGNDNGIYTIDLVTGEMEKQYTVSIAAPEGADADGFTKTFTAENCRLLSLAIDDEGNFYSVNSGDSNYKRVYLYTWSAADIGEDGNVTGLTPVNNTYDGYAGDYVYSDSEDYSGRACINTMAWDHDQDILYWASAMSVVSANNTLYIFDTETGKVSLASDAVTGVQDYEKSVLCCNVSGLYVVPSACADMPVSTEASSVGLHQQELTLMETAQYQLGWDVLPWNLSDKSVTFTSSNEKVATVDENGMVTAHSTGRATITITTKAAPYVTDICEVTVVALENVPLNGLLYDADGNVQWVEFNLTDPASWHSLYAEENYNFRASGQLGDMLYTHDGSHMYGVDADTFAVTDYGYLDPTWTWSDAAAGPKTADGYFNRIVGILNGGKSLGVMDVPAGSGYEITHYSDIDGETMAVIAYVGPATYHDGYSLNNGHEYYILTESGKLYHDIVYAFYDTDAMSVIYSDAITYVGDTGLRLNGVSNTAGSRSASMYYDAANDYLIVTSYQTGSETRVYVLDPDFCAPVEVGTFGADVWPVTSLYRYEAITELTVKVKPDIAEVYAGETVALSASVYPLGNDQAVTWSTSDETIATVDENGLVTTHAPGTVTITATSVAAGPSGDTASGTAVITVNPLKTVDETFHAYIQTADGGKWICIDGNDMSYQVLSESDASYTGAAVSQGKVYATDATYYYQIDPQGGYTVNRGDDYTNGDGAAFMYMLDGTGAPAVTREFVDLSTGETVEATVSGYPVYLSGYDGTGYHYITTLNDYATGDFGAAPIAYTYNPAAIAHRYSEEIEGYWFDFYLVLGYDGMMDMYSLYSGVADGEVFTAGGWENYSVNTGLEFEDGQDVSMVYVETDAFKGAVISHATANGTDFYSFNIETGETGKMGTIAEATDLVGLSLLADVGVEAPADPEEPSDDTLMLHGYLQTEEGGVWASIDASNMAYAALSSYGDADYTGAGVSEGMIYATDTGAAAIYQIDPANGYAVSSGAKPKYGMAIADVTGAPVKTVQLLDTATGALGDAAVGGALYATGDELFGENYVIFLNDYTTASANKYEMLDVYDSLAEAVAYVSGETDETGSYYNEHYVMLFSNGKLYDFQLSYSLYNGTVYKSVTLSEKTTLDLAVSAGASMTLMEEGVVAISVNADDGVKLYSYSLADGALTQLGVIEDAVSLAGLSLLSQVKAEEEPPVEPDPEEPTDPEEPDPEEPTDPVEPSGETVYGYVSTADGCMWIKLDPADLSYEAVSEPGTVVYNAAGENDGMIYGVTGVSKYGSTTYTYQKIDPANGYAATAGSIAASNYDPVDFTGAPTAQVTMTDSTTGETVEATVGGYILHASNGKYASSAPKLYMVKNYNASTASSAYEEMYTSSGTFSGKLAAMAYTSSALSEDGKTWYDDFLVLAQDGSLYNVRMSSAVQDGTVKINSAGMPTVTSLGTIALTPTSGASMALMGEGTLVISVTGTAGVSLYRYDLASGTLADIGTVADFASLVGIHAVVEETEAPADDTLMLHGYLTTAEGNAWASINGDDLTCETLSDYTAVAYNAAGVSEDMIFAVTGVSKYGQTTYTYQLIDPANGYAAAAAGTAAANYHPVDFTGAPAAVVTLNDTATGAAVEVNVGGYALHVSNGNYSSSAPKVYKISKTESYSEPYVPSSTFSGKLAAIAFLGGEVKADGTGYDEHFLILAQDGKLYRYTLTTQVTNGTAAIYGQAAVTELGTVELTAASGASMTLTGENTVTISVNAAEGVKLYSYDLAENVLTETGTLAGVTGLVGLSLLSDVKADAALTTAAGKAASGSLMTATLNTAAPQSVDFDTISIDAGQVTMRLIDTEAVTNGKFVVSYDPAELTFTGASSGSVYYAVNDSEAGKIVVAYAAAKAVSAGDVLAELTFSYAGTYVDTVVTVETLERGNETVSEEIQEEISNVPDVIYTSASVSLAGDIAVNYYAMLDNAVAADPGAYMQFTVADQTQIVPISEAVVSTDADHVTTYRFSCKVAAKQMTDVITGQMYLSDGTAVGEAKTYSVKAYCDAAIPVYSQYPAYADLVDLMEAMLNYGAYSQVQFGYNLDNLANAGLTDTSLPDITAADLDAYIHGADGSEDGIRVESVSLLLESTTTIRFYFRLDGTKSIEDYTFTVDGEETTPVMVEEDLYYVDKADVAAKNLDEMIIVTVGGLTARYSGLSYVRQLLAIDGYDEALVNVAKALYAYNQAANAYFG